jgi:organic hydroperoxide reductase OsmC/OhrA
VQPYPHLYHASATGGAAGVVTVASPSLPPIATTAPPEFGGPGGTWSPETLLCAAVADCFILTFRAISRAARFEWLKLECSVHGSLERVDTQASFTRFAVAVTLTVPPGADSAKARELLERAEHGCLISNSLRATRSLECTVVS